MRCGGYDVGGLCSFEADSVLGVGDAGRTVARASIGEGSGYCSAGGCEGGGSFGMMESFASEARTGMSGRVLICCVRMG